MIINNQHVVVKVKNRKAYLTIRTLEGTLVLYRPCVAFEAVLFQAIRTFEIGMRNRAIESARYCCTDRPYILADIEALPLKSDEKEPI